MRDLPHPIYIAKNPIKFFLAPYHFKYKRISSAMQNLNVLVAQEKIEPTEQKKSKNGE